MSASAAALREWLRQQEAAAQDELAALRERVAAAEKRVRQFGVSLQAVAPFFEAEADEGPVGGARTSVERSVLVGDDDAGHGAGIIAPRSLGDELSGPAAEVGEEAGGCVSSGRAGPLIDLEEGRQRILALLATADRPLKARDVAAGIGEDVTVPARVETTRGRLKNLVKEGLVAEGPGAWFSLVSDGPAAVAAGEAPVLARVNGHAGDGAGSGVPGAEGGDGLD